MQYHTFLLLFIVSIYYNESKAKKVKSKKSFLNFLHKKEATPPDDILSSA